MATVKIIKGKKITLGSKAFNIKDYGLNVLADLLQNSNNPGCTITSGSRDAYNQARIMYQVLGVEGVTYWKEVYANAGDEVIDIYSKFKKLNYDKASIITLMKDKIEDIVSQGRVVSRHMGNPDELQVYDISKNSLKNPKDFYAAAKKEASIYKKDKVKGFIRKAILEKRAYHVEIPNKGPNDPNKGKGNPSPWRNAKSEDFTFTWVKYTHTGKPESFRTLVAKKDFIGYEMDFNRLKDANFNGKTNNERVWETLSTYNKKALSEGRDSPDYVDSIEYLVFNGSVMYIPSILIKVGNVKAVNNTPPSQTGTSTQGATINIVNFEDIDFSGSENGSGTQSKEPAKIKTYTSNILDTSKKEPSLFPSVLKHLSLDPGYVPAFKNKGASAKDIYPQLSVKIWSKVLSSNGGDGFLNITYDVIRCDISSRMDGGEFSLELQPSVASYTREEDIYETNFWRKRGDLSSIDKNGEQVSMHNVNRKSTFSDPNTSKKTYEYVRNQMYYNMILQQNDMVWIKFERLNIESDQVKGENFGEWYDMIGMIDSVSVATTSMSTNSKVTVKGRDLTKSFQDDNAYFNPYSIGHAGSIYGGVFGSNGRFLRGEFKEYATVRSQTIRENIEFIFNRIATIGYVPDFVFDDLKDKTEIIVKENGKEDTILGKGIWQCIKLFIDTDIEGLILSDDSISNPDGSIWDIFKKICQEPFVELFTDTYGDKFYIVARRPPFEGRVLRNIIEQIDSIEPFNTEVATDAYREYLKSANTNNADFTGEAYKTIEDPKQFPLIININEDDVLSDTLAFSNEAYAWYQIEEKGIFAGKQKSIGHVPSAYFDEIAQIFGNKRYSRTSIYSNYKFFQTKDTKAEEDLFAEHTSQHLAFLIETNIHLPFTRRGTITLNGGDRRIKKGNYIYYRPTKEVFYVTGISHGININRGGIDRNTRIDVERGMVLDYIKGKKEIVYEEGQSIGVEEEVSYFNIVDIPKFTEGLNEIVHDGAASNVFDYKKDMKINKKVLDFFIKRRQFNQYE